MPRGRPGIFDRGLSRRGRKLSAEHLYRSHEDDVAAIAEAMREEYAAIAAAGFVLQIDCPDLAMSRHTTFQIFSNWSFCGAPPSTLKR